MTKVSVFKFIYEWKSEWGGGLALRLVWKYCGNVFTMWGQGERWWTPLLSNIGLHDLPFLWLHLPYIKWGLSKFFKAMTSSVNGITQRQTWFSLWFDRLWWFSLLTKSKDSGFESLAWPIFPKILSLNLRFILRKTYFKYVCSIVNDSMYNSTIVWFLV